MSKLLAKFVFLINWINRLFYCDNMDMDHPKLVFALCRCILASPLLLLQILSLPTFLYFAEYRRKTCFRLMFSLGLCHSIQLLVHIIAPFSKLVGLQLGEFVERLLGALLNIGWDLLFLLDLFLALERLIIVVRATIFYSSSDNEPMGERIAFNFLMAFGWLLFLAGVALFMTPCCGYVLHEATYSFHYNFAKFPWDEQIRTMEYFVDGLILQPVTFLCYLAIIVLLIKEKIARRGSISSTQPVQLLSQREMHILVQSGTQFLLLSTPILLSFIYDGDTLEFYLTLLWILINGINPIFYLTLNRDIRYNFMKMVGNVRQKVFSASYASSTIMVAPAEQNRQINNHI